MSKNFEIKGKFALVTGGASGIGLAYVKELMKNGLKGVAIVDIIQNGNDVAETINKEYGAESAMYVAADCTKMEQMEDAFKKTLAKFKSLDIVINNAGMMNDFVWEKQIALNCNAVTQGSLLGMKYMGKNNGEHGGVVVNIASILGLQNLSGCPVYVGTKHFVVGLTRSFGSEYYWNLTGIKFLTMCPGVTDTPLISEAGRYSLQGFPNLGELLAQELGSLPPQRPENVAKGMITLITKGDNGSVWVSEGGQDIYEVDIPERTTLKKQ